MIIKVEASEGQWCTGCYYNRFTRCDYDNDKDSCIGFSTDYIFVDAGDVFRLNGKFIEYKG